MAELPTTSAVTLVDIAKSLDPNGRQAKIIEMLSTQNDILTDILWLQANNKTSHVTTVRTGDPTVYWRMLNRGVQQSKSLKGQIVDTCGRLEGYSNIDEAFDDQYGGNIEKFRATEDQAFVSALSKEVAQTLFYGNTDTAPEEFMGLAPRYASTSLENGTNIIDAGGTGSDNTSIFLVMWGEQTCAGIYPEGSKAGMDYKNLGKQLIRDENDSNRQYMAYVSQFVWRCGLSLRDWRAVVRIPNIDVSELTKTASSGADIIDLMIQALWKLPTQISGRKAFYCNKTIGSFLDRQLYNKSNMNLSYVGEANKFGEKPMALRGVPIRINEAIVDTESAVS